MFTALISLLCCELDLIREVTQKTLWHQESLSVVTASHLIDCFRESMYLLQHTSISLVISQFTNQESLKVGHQSSSSPALWFFCFFLSVKSNNQHENKLLTTLSYCFLLLNSCIVIVILTRVSDKLLYYILHHQLQKIQILEAIIKRNYNKQNIIHHKNQSLVTFLGWWPLIYDRQKTTINTRFFITINFGFYSQHK